MTVSHPGQEKLRWRGGERVKLHPVWFIQSTKKRIKGKRQRRKKIS